LFDLEVFTSILGNTLLQPTSALPLEGAVMYFLALGEQLGFVLSRDFTSIFGNTLLQPTSALPLEGATMYFLALGEP
jgi:hypothetical protein